MARKILAATFLLLIGLVLASIALGQFVYQQNFAQAYSVKTEEIVKDYRVASDVEEEYIKLLQFPFANQFIILYNLALLSYSRGEYDEGLGYLQEASTTVANPKERADLFYAFSEGAIKRDTHFRDPTNPKDEQLFFLRQTLREKPNHFAAKRMYEILMRERKREKEQGLEERRAKPPPQEEPQRESGPGYDKSLPKP